MSEADKIKKQKNVSSTQAYLDIAEIRDDTVIMRDGSLRQVILVSSINFALKSEDEQNAVIQSYVSFLNYLEHPLQIVVQSRKLNIDGYLNDLKEIEKNQNNELLKMQTAEYGQFISELVELGEIMSKKFYVVVPYTVGADKRKGFFEKVSGVFSPLTNIKIQNKQFMEYKKELENRVNTAMAGLSEMGLTTAILDTQALIELYYNTYNPQVSENQKMANLEELKVE